MEANCAIETAKNRFQGMRPDNREHGDRHQSNRPEYGDLRKPEPGPEAGRNLTGESGRNPENGRDDQRAGGQNPTWSTYLKAGQTPAKSSSEHHAFMPALSVPALLRVHTGGDASRIQIVKRS